MGYRQPALRPISHAQIVGGSVQSQKTSDGVGVDRASVTQKRAESEFIKFIVLTRYEIFLPAGRLTNRLTGPNNYRRPEIGAAGRL